MQKYVLHESNIGLGCNGSTRLSIHKEAILLESIEKSNSQLHLTLPPMFTCEFESSKLCSTACRHPQKAYGFQCNGFDWILLNHCQKELYDLTVICMLIRYVFCVSVPDQTAHIVITAYPKEVYCRSGVVTKFDQTMEASVKQTLYRYCISIRIKAYLFLTC